MEVNGQLHDPAASLIEPTGQEAGWATELSERDGEEKKTCQESNPDRSACSQSL